MDNYSDIRYFIQQLTTGSEEAWSYFLRHYGGLVFFCIKAVLSPHTSEEDREDCFQKILEILIEDDYRRLKQFRSNDKKAFCSWLGSLARRRAINYIRGIKDPSPLPDEIINSITHSSRSPDIETLRSQLYDIIEQKLPEKERLVMLYLLEGLTLEEISPLMDLKLGTVFNIKKKAVSELKALFRQVEKK